MAYLQPTKGFLQLSTEETMLSQHSAENHQPPHVLPFLLYLSPFERSILDGE